MSIGSTRQRLYVDKIRFYRHISLDMSTQSTITEHMSTKSRFVDISSLSCRSHRHDDAVMSTKPQNIDMSRRRRRSAAQAQALDRPGPHRPFTSPHPHSKRPRPMASERYNAPVREKHWQTGVGGARHLPHPGQEQEAQALPARDVPLSVGPRAHGARAQLHAGRRDGPLHARQGLQRAASHGLGRVRAAGRERRHGAQDPPAQVDLREHRHHARPAQGHGRCRSTGAASSPPAIPPTTCTSSGCSWIS